MRLTAVLVVAGTALLAVVAWCLVSGKPVSQIGVDAITAATRPKKPHKPSTPKTPTETPAQTTARDEANITEAVFRYQFAHYLSSNDAGPAAYFIAFGSSSSPRDPNADFLKRFAGNTPPVKAASASKRAAAGAVVDKSTSKPGVLFRVERIKWLGKDTAEVHGGLTESTKTTTTESWQALRQGTTWSVTPCHAEVATK